MTEPKPFQVATIQAVLRALHSSKGSKRFLVADEVGLGKSDVNAISRWWSFMCVAA